MKRKANESQQAANGAVRVKAEQPVHVKLYTDTDTKVRERARRKGVAAAQIVCDIVDEHFRQQALLPDDERRSEEFTAEVQFMREAVSKLGEDLHAGVTLMEAKLTGQMAEQRVLFEAERNALKAQFGLLQVILQSLFTTEQICTQYLADPHIRGRLAHTTAEEVFNEAKLFDEGCSEVTNAVLNAIRAYTEQGTKRVVGNMLGRFAPPEDTAEPPGDSAAPVIIPPRAATTQTDTEAVL